MEIRQECGYVYTFHKFRKFEIQNKDGIRLIFVELQEGPKKRWKEHWFLPYTITYTDIPEMRLYIWMINNV